MGHKVATYLQEDLHDITITLVGAGGNGSFMLTNLARINYALRGLGRKGLHVTIIDFDEVSFTNVGRQLFSHADIGKKKSEVLIQRVNRAFGTAWSHRDDNITNYDSIDANIIITAVDNVKARRHVREVFCNSNKNGQDIKNNLYWMDLGNGKDYGQVILGDKKNLKNLFDFYPDLKDSKNDGPSCSMLAALKKQDLFINSTISQFASKLLFELLTKKTIDNQGVYLNLKTLSLKPINL